MYNAPGFDQQRPVEFNFFGYPLLVPSGHPLLGHFTPRHPWYQPYRETGLVKIVKALQQQGRSGTVVDIGANVGDSCAIIYGHSNFKILAVEASDFFFDYLSKNVARLFSDRVVAKQMFVVPAPGIGPTGLYHWGGTAKAVDAPFTEKCQSVTINSLLGLAGEVALLKIDVDGLDVDLVSSLFMDQNIIGHGPIRFPIYFEYEFPGDTRDKIQPHYAKLISLFEKVVGAGYEFALVWDDPGRFYGLVDLRNRLNVTNAVNYMGHFRQRMIWGYDICLVHRSDHSFTSELCKIISQEAIIPVSVTD